MRFHYTLLCSLKLDEEALVRKFQRAEMEISSVQTGIDKTVKPPMYRLPPMNQAEENVKHSLRLHNKSTEPLQIVCRVSDLYAIEASTPSISAEKDALVANLKVLQTDQMQVTFKHDYFDPNAEHDLDILVTSRSAGMHMFRLFIDTWICDRIEPPSEDSIPLESRVNLTPDQEVYLLDKLIDPLNRYPPTGVTYRRRTGDEAHKILIVDIQAPLFPPRLTLPEKTGMRFYYNTSSTPLDTKIVGSPRPHLNSLKRSITVLNHFGATLNFQVVVSGPFTAKVSKTTLLPGEVATLTAEFITTGIKEKKHSLLMDGYWRPESTVTGDVTVDFGAGFTQAIPLEATVVWPRVNVHFPEIPHAPSLIDYSLLAGIDKSLPTLNFGFSLQTSFYPPILTFKLTNETSAVAAWSICEVKEKRAEPETQVRLFREREAALGVDAGFAAFKFTETEGKLRGPTRHVWAMPHPQPMPATHADSADFEPHSVSVTFTPPVPGYFRSVFKLEYSGERTILFACEGCASKEEVDELRISPGLFAALQKK